ncbi:DMT family transporter [Sphingomonas crocodyli]|uniref:DMT family transporter n=1 Tax=Sphingomonas crocodyli TaxID=1979270 RepID=A0A437M933_9SPHN|nr:DMT family transporter [Sphingomonas crocodyli]RVT94159.1 DMT family transporter [Sphingomonas crocodyli]
MIDDHNHNLRGIMFRCVSVICFAIMAAAMKWASEAHVTAIEMLFVRSTIGLPIVVGWLLIGPGIGIIRTKRPKAHLIRSMIGMSGILMTFQGLILLPLAEVTTIGFSAPIFATILSALILKEKVGGHRWTAVLFGFLGVAIVVRPGGGGEALSQFGVIAALLGAVGTAGVTITIRQLGGTEQPGTIVFWFFVSCAVVSGAAMPFYGHLRAPETYAVMCIAGFAGAAAQILMTMSLKAAPVSVVAPFDYGQIIWASLLGWLFWSTTPTLNTLAGAGLIVFAGLYTAWRESRKRRVTVAATPPLE